MNKGWLELESDPGLFTLLLEDFGVNGIQVEEIYDLQKSMEGPVYGFIFLFRWIEERRSRRKTNTEVESFVTDSEAVNKIFFAQQIIPNSCATHALLSVLLNCDNKVKLGKTLDLIKDFTDNMSPEDKGYAIANMPELARVHNSFARPEVSKPLPEKQTGLSSVRAMDSETFHFVSYVPIRGHLFELDGLKPHPIDHGPWEKGEDWTEKFRRVITDRLGMATGGEPYHDIRFNLMTVVPDKRQLLEHKLATLKTNRNIVLEALKQVVSPVSSEKSDSDSRSQIGEVKKSVTFTTSPAPSVMARKGSSVVVTNNGERPTEIPAVVEMLSQHPSLPAPAGHETSSKMSVSQPSSILKLPSSAASTTVSSLTFTTSSSLLTTLASIASSITLSAVTAASDLPQCSPSPTTATSEQMKLRSSAGAGKTAAATTSAQINSSSALSPALEMDEPKVDSVETLPSQGDSCDKKEKVDDSSIKQEPMDTMDKDLRESEFKPVLTKHVVKSEEASVEAKGAGEKPASSTTLKSDVTKPLSIETKFSTSPCAASNESTDTASEIGSGFSSPGSLNTSSCQSSPQFSDGTIGDGKSESDSGHIHSHKRKRRSSQAFTPKDLLDLLKNVDNEIELCENNLKEENEKRKKYKIDACRRTHNYDQFIMTFLSMLAEQGLLGDLMEENMSIKKAGSNVATGPKMAKKVLLKASEKKKKTKIKKKGKK